MKMENNVSKGYECVQVDQEAGLRCKDLQYWQVFTNLFPGLLYTIKMKNTDTKYFLASFLQWKTKIYIVQY